LSNTIIISKLHLLSTYFQKPVLFLSFWTRDRCKNRRGETMGIIALTPLRATQRRKQGDFESLRDEGVQGDV
jgi:hypothetical protein